ncbi:uncharacterized protein LOC133726593 isoform X2 [Rosa rugosa]|uniref:uncharacterized protein LOC133726593 isoform X2 n=1 Tax=Rosa rugosa TaxID=74645 RepID=UPI002B404CF9|nr:uncharacterized protein LOC133726593 isoform X2 [Rosa rugosa]
MEKVPIVDAAKGNWKKAEVEAKSETGEGNGNKQSHEAKSGIVEASGNKSYSGKIEPDESASVEQGLVAEVVGGESKTDSETEKMLESMKELNKKLMEMMYKGKLTCEYDKENMKSKTKSNDDDDDDEEPLKGCMSWLL